MFKDKDWVEVHDSTSPFDGWAGWIEEVLPENEPAGSPRRYRIWMNGLRLTFREGQLVASEHKH